jgi:RHS repeat-associated protein
MKTYVYANSQILAQHNGNYNAPRFFYLHDRLGSVRLVINSTGDVNDTYTYNPFGEMFAAECNETVSNPFKFTGQFYDSETGQYYLRARMYDPLLIRFTSRDPVFGKFEEPMTLHKYLYCGNNPLNYTDAAGLRAFYLTGGFGAALGFGLQNQVGITWDDRGNLGIIVMQNIGVSFPIAASAGVQFGFTFGNENIMDLRGPGWSFGGGRGIFGVDYFFGRGVRGIEISIGADVSWPDFPGEGHYYQTNTEVLPFHCQTLTFEDILDMAVEEAWNRSRTLRDYEVTLMWMGMTDTDFDF